MIPGFERFTAIDVETTGLAEDAHIIEIGLVSVNDGKIVDRWRSFVRPPESVPREITQLTGITNRMVMDAPLWEDIEGEVLARTEGRLLVAHNVHFDKGRIEFELGRPLEADWLDSHDLAKLFLPTLTSYKLAAIATHLDIADPGHHRALNDAHVCAAVTLRLFAIAQSIDPFVLQEMAAIFALSEGSVAKLFDRLSRALPPDADLPIIEETFFEPIQGVQPLLSFADAEHFFSHDGPLAAHRDDFESRPQQIAMLRTICEAFTDRRHSIIEAGTGTGKSFAYLVPALLWGYERNCRVVVSTATIALQEQLYRHDIPFLQKVLEYPFQATIVKGRNNYLCKRRFANTLQNTSALSWNERLFFASLLYWQAYDTSGERERLNLNKMENQFWFSVAATADTCIGKRCPHFRDCYYFNNKRAAEKSQLIIVNHSLLLQDMRLDHSILPGYEHIIIDEAHHLEEEATRQLTDVVDLEWLRKTAHALTRPAGLFIRIQSQCARCEELNADFPTIERILSEARRSASDLVKSLAETIQKANELPDLANVGERRITEKVRQKDWWQGLALALSNGLNLLHGLTAKLQRLLHHMEFSENLEEIHRELTFATDQLAQQSFWLERFLTGDETDYVYWASAQRAGWGSNFLLSAALVDVTPILSEKLFQANDSVILTSATLAINQNLNYTAAHFLLPENSYSTHISASPFDYNRQSLIAIPSDHPDYSKTSDIAYSQMVSEDLAQLIPAVDGDMLVLFTSYAMLNRVYFSLKKNRDLNAYTILGHGQDGSRSSILAAMQNRKKTVVLGAASFWEGVDVKGHHLRTVVIVKLPFAPPTMPLESARSERIKAEGKNPFTELSLPQAILRFRQGCGRLIRSADDWGVIIILDNRVIDKPYGKYFLSSLPEQPLLQESMPMLCTQLKAWMDEKKSEA